MSDNEILQPTNVGEVSEKKDPLYFASESDSESSPESEDSLELSESESITDVTPLNSPYCDSPLPQARSTEITQIKDYYDDPSRGEMNVLMQAIRKLEIERAPNSRAKNSTSYRKKTSDSCSTDSTRRVDSESSLLKQVMSQQGRAKSSSSHDRLLHRRSTVINRRRQIVSATDVDVNVLSNDSISTRPSRELSEAQVHRQVKCLSHPTCSPYSYPVLESTVRCGKELKTIDCGQGPSVQGATFSNSSEPIPNIESNVVAH